MSLGTCRLYNDQPARAFGEPAHHITLEWNRAVIYRAPNPDPRPRPANPNGSANLTRGIFNGYMSPATKRLVRRRASTWLRSIFLYREHLKRKWDSGKPYPTFVTLTLPVAQQHDDRTIGRVCLAPFVQRLKREHGVEHYFWRAEAQENGNLHYHLIIDRFVPKERIQDLWLLSIDALDYRSRYFAESGSLYPPATEVHAIRSQCRDKRTGKMKDVDPVDYLVDYFLEVPEPAEPLPAGEPLAPADRPMIGRYRTADGKVHTYRTRGINGRVWGMSDTLRDLRPARAEVTHRLNAILHSAADRRQLRRVQRDHATLFFGQMHRVIKAAHKLTARLLVRHYLHAFAYVYPMAVPPSFAEKYPPADPALTWLDLSTFTTPSIVQTHGRSFTFPTSSAAHRFIALCHRYADP